MPGTSSRTLRPRQLLVAYLGLAFFAVSLLGPAGYLLYLQNSGPRARATVSDCETTGYGKYASTICTGSWIVGGDLIEGDGHVEVGTIQGVDEGDKGKTIDVTLHGGEAYSRGLGLPLILAGFGLLSLALMLLIFVQQRRLRAQAAPATDPLDPNQKPWRMDGS